MNTEMSQQLYSSQGSPVRLGARIGQGGEGTVHDAADHDGLVAKLYHKPVQPEKAAKLSSMVALKTERLLRLSAWPVDTLHEHGILHRDVKPSNVLLDGAGIAALSDFGLARTPTSTRLTEDGQLVGTPHYLAPELIEGHDATRASDIYAFGCMLFECLVGQPPFGRRSVVELGFAHLVETPPDPRDLRPELPADVGVALLKALEKNPADRPTTATALARMLHVARTAACS